MMMSQQILQAARYLQRHLKDEEEGGSLRDVGASIQNLERGGDVEVLHPETKRVMEGIMDVVEQVRMRINALRTIRGVEGAKNMVSLWWHTHPISQEYRKLLGEIKELLPYFDPVVQHPAWPFHEQIVEWEHVCDYLCERGDIQYISDVICVNGMVHAADFVELIRVCGIPMNLETLKVYAQSEWPPFLDVQYQFAHAVIVNEREYIKRRIMDIHHETYEVLIKYILPTADAIKKQEDIFHEPWIYRSYRKWYNVLLMIFQLWKMTVCSFDLFMDVFMNKTFIKHSIKYFLVIHEKLLGEPEICVFLKLLGKYFHNIQQQQQQH